ncbi:hypothetical protein NMG29_39425 [Streptomyces cocklensis]|nr:hypothetical protein [Actinacidiphila cocklensis]MDD1064151.1 hypothetical protein [Actinacidiphila cocklensis]WSX75571.1 hypothetical protein OH826_17800 [Streptomyces sp. NBC_00899]
MPGSDGESSSDPDSGEAPSPASGSGPGRGSLRRGQWSAASGTAASSTAASVTGPSGADPDEPEEPPAADGPGELRPRRNVPTTAVLAAVAVLLVGLGTALAVQLHGHTSSGSKGRADTAATSPAAPRQTVQASLPAASATRTPRKGVTKKPSPPPQATTGARTAPPPPAQQHVPATVGSEAKKTQAPERTAATAVQQLAAGDPSGRHICYRVYTATKGWTAPACDGQTAGTVGGAPLRAVDIAVFGTKGTSGGANVHNPKGEDQYFPDPWSIAADGVDNYVGSTAKDAPFMRGFTINVGGGDGTVCQSGYVSDDGWLDLACDDPGSGYSFTYAGTYANNAWIEAVKLKV